MDWDNNFPPRGMSRFSCCNGNAAMNNNEETRYRSEMSQPVNLFISISYWPYWPFTALLWRGWQQTKFRGCTSLSISPLPTTPHHWLRKQNTPLLPPQTEKGESPTAIMLSYYRGTIESVITGCIAVWFGSCSASYRKALQQVQPAGSSASLTIPTRSHFSPCSHAEPSILVVTPPTHYTPISASCLQGEGTWPSGPAPQNP